MVLESTTHSALRRPFPAVREETQETERVMSDKDVWAATQLSNHRERIRVLEAQVTALNWILHAVVKDLPPKAYENLIPHLTKETKRLKGLMPEAEEVDRKGLDAGRNILLSARDAAFSVVKGWTEKRD